MTSKGKTIVIGAFVIILAVAGFVASKAEEKKVGDACETYQSSACGGPGGACLASPTGNYCSIACAGDAECPSGWACAEIAADTYNGKGEKTATAQKKMCVRR